MQDREVTYLTVILEMCEARRLCTDPREIAAITALLHAELKSLGVWEHQP